MNHTVELPVNEIWKWIAITSQRWWWCAQWLDITATRAAQTTPPNESPWPGGGEESWHRWKGPIIGELPKLCVNIRPDSWLVCCPFRCHREWRHEWQHGGLCPCRRSFGCVLLLDQIFRKQCTVRQYTTLIYLINLLGKLVLGLGLDSELYYFSIFTENKKNEHLIFCECHGR